MRKQKSHDRNIIADTKLREEGGGGGLAATLFPHAMDYLAETEAEKTGKKSEFEPGKKSGKGKEASVLVLLLTILLFY